jgi:hypothetical protein
MNLAFDFNAPPELTLTAPQSPTLPHNGKPTSQSAAASVSKSGRALIDRERVYQCVLASGKRGMTRGDLEDALSLDGNTLRPRVWELLGNNGFAIRLIETEERQAPDCNPSGRRQSVLVVASWAGGEK